MGDVYDGDKHARPFVYSFFHQTPLVVQDEIIETMRVNPNSSQHEFDVDHVIKNASMLEKISLLAGKTPHCFPPN